MTIKTRLNYAVLIQIIQSSYYQLSLAIFLQYFRVSFSNTFNQVSFVLTVGGTLFNFIVIIWFAYEINKSN